MEILPEVDNVKYITKRTEFSAVSGASMLSSGLDIFSPTSKLQCTNYRK